YPIDSLVLWTGSSDGAHSRSPAKLGRGLAEKWIHISVSIGYTTPMTLKTKDAGLRLRVEKELRQEFVDACRATGKPAAQVLREFMRDFVTRERVMIQRPLFEEGQR